MLFDPYPAYKPRDFVFKIATTPQELDGYWQLRRDVFCEEQGVFVTHDRDAVDDHAIPIICAVLVAGMVDDIVGTVRIDQRKPRLWYGSRLCVHKDFRRLTEMSPGVSVRNHQPVHRGFGALGAGLIYKAVSTAGAIGCDRFLANVQEQNARFFQRLHWRKLSEEIMHGRMHAHMEAELPHYPPAQMVA
ncbi:MAG: MSMEG_0567/Sll0786 family nitrogen starvation N-acetyltransferase [Verrucomicrobium sp.]